jgi:hypothetical protein
MRWIGEHITHSVLRVFSRSSFSVLAMDEWVIESLKAIQLHTTRSGVSAFIFGSQVPPPSRAEIIGKFNEIASLMEAKLYRLVSVHRLCVG